jgi:hypothetical protein
VIRKCLNVFANAVAMMPAEKRHPPRKAIFRYPNLFKRAPLKSPRSMPSAEFKLRMSAASRAVKWSSSNLSLKISDDEVMTGMMSI